MSNPAAALNVALAEHRERVNSGLERYLKQYATDCPAALVESMHYTVIAPGKRLRPALVFMACEACGGQPEDALPAACAIELIHTYSLIHDDLPSMDDDALRRGRPTCHIQYGEANAILTGDALLTLAFEILAAELQPAEIAAACCVELAAAAGPCGMVAGQVADLAAQSLHETEYESAQSSSSSEAVDTVLLSKLEDIHHRKTGRLLSAALIMGARIAQADQQRVESLKAYGKCVGLAFQIADDLLDTSGDVSKTGKQVQKDLDHGKLTYPALLGIENSRRRAQELIEEACQQLAGLGEKAERLEALARFVIERDH